MVQLHLEAIGSSVVEKAAVYRMKPQWQEPSKVCLADSAAAAMMNAHDTGCWVDLLVWMRFERYVFRNVEAERMLSTPVRVNVGIFI